MRSILILTAALLLAACGDEEGSSPGGSGSTTPSPFVTATITGSNTGGPLGSPTIVSPLSIPEEPALPSNWLTYEDPERRFVLQYPPEWFAEDGILSTFMLGSVGTDFPAEAIKIDVGYSLISQLGTCSGEVGSSDTRLDGEPAKIISRVYAGSVVTRADVVTAANADFCYGISVLFSQGEPDISTVARIIGSFRFGN
jgi:hypothetical protein